MEGDAVLGERERERERLGGDRENRVELEVEGDPNMARHRTRILDFERRIKEAKSRVYSIMGTVSDAEMS